MLLTPNHLIVFTRYPTPGTAKTRLMPALGAAGAATVSRQLTEHTLTQIHTCQLQFPDLQVEIRFAGGTREQMVDWLGSSWGYTPQGDGDLGDRLARAVPAAIAAGATRIVMVGTDCPELDAACLQQAFHALTTHDLVLGPALDGGYYLIGVRHDWPALFHNIAWSTAAVCAQTIAIGQQLGLAIAHLPTLADIDEPADLAIWERVQATRGESGVPESA